MKAFSGGYFIRSVGAQVQSEKVQDWPRILVGDLEIGTSENTLFSYSIDSKSGCFVVIIGTAIDVVSGSIDQRSIVSNILRLVSPTDLDAALKNIAYLAGRFIAVIGNATRTRIVPDCHATLASFWTEKQKKVVVASHSYLTALLVGAELDKVSLEIQNSSDYVEPGGKYYPGILTPYENIRPIIANCFLEIDSTGHVLGHTRFYPWRDIVEKSSLDVTFSDFAIQLNEVARLHAALGPSSVSLTAGLDSRTLLKSLAPNLLPGSKSYTYVRFEDGWSHYAEDLIGASRYSSDLSVPHQIIRLEKFNPSDTWNSEYVKTFPKGSRFPALAKCYEKNFERKDISILGTGAETGTVFYEEREVRRISPQRLADKFTLSKIGKSQLLFDVFEEYIDYTQFNDEQIGSIDYHDLFYWEHRNSKWANLWYSELDLSHRSFVPFNSRALIEVMLTLPFELRKSKYLLNRFLAT